SRTSRSITGENKEQDEAEEIAAATNQTSTSTGLEHAVQPVTVVTKRSEKDVGSDSD
ncbi:unnamed protein product, partial [Amoebophrya sp. A120]